MTVLFADLVGFTPFAEERDAEEVRDTLERYAAIAHDIVARYGGTVEKFIGDAVMAVWGTPTAHEDDAERAVRAALELTDSVGALGPQIQARAGVLTGEAAVNMGATDQNLLAGDLVNTAARLQSGAPPGAVLVGESTMRATSSSVAYEAAGDQALKGKQTPVPAWQALRVIAQRRGAGRSESVETPFVGREEEFRLLKDQLHLSGRDPRTRLVSITGPAGIGKSRLVWELEKYIDGIVDTIYWHRGRCPAYGEGVSFWALGEMVRRRAGLAEGDDEAKTRQRLRATVDEYVADPGERDWINSALLALLGVEQQAEGGRETLFSAWRRFFENVAARGTTVLVFEDLHWADPGLLDFIDHLLDWSKGSPLMVVTLARPELFDRRPDWGAARRTFSALALDPLSDACMTEMLRAVVPDLPAEALAHIVARADGIPLYAVETVRMLLADGRLAESPDGGYRLAGELGGFEVPDSLRSLITSRLDAVDPADRRLIQDASVLGQTFGIGALAALTDEPAGELDARLRQLVRRELLTLEMDPRSPERGLFGFTQSLVREVAYSTLTKPQRRERHLAAARYLEATGGEELAAALAGHYVAAFHASTAGPEADAVAAQARIALRGAADRAAALGSHKQAAEFIIQALVVTTVPNERAQLFERHASEVSLAGRPEESEKSARAAIDLYQKLDDQSGLARSRTLLGYVLIMGSKEKASLSELDAAVAALPADVEPAIRADMLAKLARAAYRNQDWQRAVSIADEAMAIAEQHRLLYVAADAMTSKGSALDIGVRLIEGLTLLRGGYELARRIGDTATELRAAANLSLGLASEEGNEAAMEITLKALETARRVGDFPQVVWHTSNAVFGSLFMGRPLAEAQARTDDLMAMGLSSGDRATLLRGQAWINSLTGDDVEPILAEYVALAGEDAVKKGAGLDLYRFFGALGRADFSAASAIAEKTHEDRPELGILPWAVFAAVLGDDLAKARRLLYNAERAPVLGRDGEAQTAVARVAVSAIERQAREQVPAARDALRAIEELQNYLAFGLCALTLRHALGPDVPEAREWAERGLAIFEGMGTKPMAELARRELARSPRNETAQPAPGAMPAATANPVSAS